MLTLAFINNLLGPDTLIILAFAMLFFGAKRLPELARGMGEAIREFSKAKNDITAEITAPPNPPAPPTQPA